MWAFLITLAPVLVRVESGKRLGSKERAYFIHLIKLGPAKRLQSMGRDVIDGPAKGPESTERTFIDFFCPGTTSCKMQMFSGKKPQ